jgi:DNA-binding XRE family transcriptional regulator
MSKVGIYFNSRTCNSICEGMQTQIEYIFYERCLQINETLEIFKSA